VIATPYQQAPEVVPSTPGILARHWAELQASAIAPDVAAANVASWGPATERHWELERVELVRFARLKVQTESVAGNGCPQAKWGWALVPGTLEPGMRRFLREHSRGPNDS